MRHFTAASLKSKFHPVVGTRSHGIWPRPHRLLIVAASMLISVTASAQDAHILREPPLALRQILRWHDSHSTTIVPIRLAGRISADNLQVQIINVAAGGVDRPDLFAAFKPAVDATAVRLDVDYDQVATPADYAVAVELSEAKVEGRSERFVVQLRVGAASLRIPPTVTINEGEESAKIKIEEVGGGWLSHLSIAEEERAKNGGVIVPATIVVHGGGQPVLPMSIQEVELKPSDQFPLGTSTGKLRIGAPELPSPLFVSYEVHRRRSSYFIILAFLASAVVGTFLRKTLKDREHLAALRTQAARLNEDVGRLTEGRFEKTADLEVQATAVLERMNVAAAKKDAGELATLVQQASEFVPRLQEARMRYRQSELLSLSGLLDELGETADVHNSMAGQDVVKALEAYRTSLLENRLTDAERFKREVSKSEQVYLSGRAAWATGFKTSFAALLKPESGVPVDDSWKGEGEKLVTQLQNLESRSVEGQALTPAFLIEDRNAVARATNLLRQLAWAIRKEAEGVRAIAGSQGSLQALEEIGRLPIPTEPSIATVSNLHTAARELSSAVRAIVGPKPSHKVEEYMGAGRHVEALAEVPRKGELMGGGQSGNRTEEVSPTKDALVVGGDSSPFGWSYLPPSGIRRQLVLLGAETPLVNSYVEESRLTSIRWLRSVGSAVVISVAAWAIFKETWIGTLKDFAGVCSIAFCTDFTVATLTEYVQKLKLA